VSLQIDKVPTGVGVAVGTGLGVRGARGIEDGTGVDSADVAAIWWPTAPPAVEMKRKDIASENSLTQKLLRTTMNGLAQNPADLS
jgi:hypothetical protein